MTLFSRKYITAFAATAVLALGLYGCGGGGGGSDPTTGGGGMMPTDVDLSNVTPGFMTQPGNIRLAAGQSLDHGDIAFSCATGGADCEIAVMEDANGAITASSTGGMVTAMNSDAYTARITPMAVDLASVTAGFMAGAGTVQVPAGQSADHGDIEFTCAAGGADCEVTVTVDANGAITATSTGGMVMAMNSDAYDTRVTTLARNESNLIHMATGADRVRSGEQLFASTASTPASHYVGVVQTHSGSQYAVALPWQDDQGQLNFTISLGSVFSADELDPIAWLGRSVDTSDSAYTAANEDADHDLGSDWRVFELTKQYSGAGTLTVNVATDAGAAHSVEEPWVGYGDFARQIELHDIPTLPAGQDWQGVPATNGLDGSLDGEPGRFTCASGQFCALELDRNGASVGYYPGYGDVIFTPDDSGLSPTTLESTTSIDRLPPTDYLIFGSWLYVPEDIASADDYDFGVLAGGGDPFSTSTYGLAGTAAYAGGASGKYYTGRSSASPMVDSFDAKVALTADFDNALLGGRVHDFRFNPDYSCLV